MSNKEFRRPIRGFYLAFDTSTSIGSVALGNSTEVLARSSLRKENSHSSDLVPKIYDTLEEGGVSLEELSGLIVGLGPGSFTGVRVAAATAKGLARALNVPLWGISSLEAGAAAVDKVFYPFPNGIRQELSADELSWPRYVLFDARGDRVYAACYLPTEQGLKELISPCATTIKEILSSRVPFSIFGGDGADRHADKIRGAGFPVFPSPLGMPTADGLLTVFRNQPELIPITDISRWEPEYLRLSSAERLSG